MKKYILIIAAIFTAALLAPGCYPNENVELNTNTKGLTISLFSDEPETKADPTRETKISHFDYFFFKDATGTELIDVTMQGRATGSSKTFETGIGKDFVKLRKVTSYVYIIANFPGNIAHNRAWTLEQLKALEFESKLVTAVNEETGAVTFFTDMVMDSYNKTGNTYTTELTPAEVEEARTVDIGLTRIASKLALNFTIPASVPGSMTGENEKWTPVLKDLRAYYVNALNTKSTVGATPIQRSDASASMTKEDYFSYPTNYPISPDPLTVTDPLTITDPDYKYEFSIGDVYTYPQTWIGGENGEPYFKVQITWWSNVRGTANFYYKICVPKPATDGTVTIDRNTCYVVDVNLDVIDTENEYVVVDPAHYTVHEWAVNEWKGGSGMAAARFFDVPKREFILYSDESVDIPFSSNSAVSAIFTEVSYWYYGSTNGTHYHFRYPVADSVYQMTLPQDKDSDNQSLNVTNYAGISVNAAKDMNEYKLEPAAKYVKFTHALTDIFSVRTIKILLKNEEGRTAEVTITQHPAIEVVAHPSKNMFLDGWYYLGDENVRDADGNLTGYKHTPTGNPYMPHIPYWRTRTAWHADGSNYYGTIFANSNTSVKADHFFLTEVSVSAFTDSNNKYKVRSGSNTGTITEKAYRLGDPRVRAGVYYYTATSTSTPKFILPDYLYSDKAKREDLGGGSYREYDDPTDSLRAWEQPMRVLIASQNVNDQNIIAPRLLVSSHMNITSGVKWNNTDGSGVVQRCAMYQENGYPAGRWRLPTEAEVAFMMRLQSDGTLPGLFADNCNYWLADGRMIHVGTGGNIYPYVANRSGTVYIRMVYDLWYWGEEPTEGVDKIRTPDMMTDWEKAMSEDGVTPNWKAHWADYYHPNMHEH